MARDADTPLDGRRVVDEQRAETGASGTIGPSTPALPDSMSRGLWRGGLLGAVVGAVLLTPAAFIDFLDVALIGRLVIVWIVGFAAGAAVGAVFFGGAVAEDETEENEPTADMVPDQMHRNHGDHQHLS